MTDALTYSSHQQQISDNPSIYFKKQNQHNENHENPRTLRELIEYLYEAFSTDMVDLDYLHTIMTNYKSSPKDWQQYAKFKQDRYTRNLVDGGNGKFNLMLLCWSEGQGSSIHDHTNSHCFMKCLDGKLVETRYEWPTEDDQQEDDKKEKPMKLKYQSDLNYNDVLYINDSLGLHRVENPSHTDKCVTLHLYIPPYHQCHTFDERTGKQGQVVVTFYSKYGQILEKETPAL
ncbi:unnamed protein product [Didymodactylos carnosus]|uniref:Cysteine dioxygenase n=1 Tax=Didymodactylos carnosus TaxID=1234261 RepID=A0A814I5S6_9BILA|nr:unnamed protein product [Didymodactylos carnosus]CAF1018669.1 unnamed protein product [Didymodactylos carnosus]CAF3635080.1 unnamed protein product [Didymodactylos carnosus]CAF3790166.1 unnamed protein product [Didymodactylos carnosus]